MGRPKMKAKDKVGEAVTVRITPEVKSRVEDIRQALQAKTPYAKVTQADVLRHIITEASAQPSAFGIDNLGD